LIGAILGQSKGRAAEGAILGLLAVECIAEKWRQGVAGGSKPSPPATRGSPEAGSSPLVAFARERSRGRRGLAAIAPRSGAVARSGLLAVGGRSAEGQPGLGSARRPAPGALAPRCVCGSRCGGGAGA